MHTIESTFVWTYIVKMCSQRIVRVNFCNSMIFWGKYQFFCFNFKNIIWISPVVANYQINPLIQLNFLSVSGGNLVRHPDIVVLLHPFRVSNFSVIFFLQMRGRGRVAGSQPMSTAVPQINLGDLTPYLTYNWTLFLMIGQRMCLIPFLGQQWTPLGISTMNNVLT